MTDDEVEVVKNAVVRRALLWDGFKQDENGRWHRNGLDPVWIATVRLAEVEMYVRVAIEALDRHRGDKGS